ncbi:hypothetical protein NMY22_g14872 [Coprinellus aureogranulatus]|nr:hypothetical protein NMY22_g14872 [Coprinellus aureogranulatus]
MGPNISEQLELRLKGCGSVDAGTDGSNAPAGLADFSAPARAGTPPPSSTFDQFLDFSNVGEEDVSTVDT